MNSTLNLVTTIACVVVIVLVLAGCERDRPRTDVLIEKAYVNHPNDAGPNVYRFRDTRYGVLCYVTWESIFCIREER